MLLSAIAKPFCNKHATVLEYGEHAREGVGGLHHAAIFGGDSLCYHNSTLVLLCFATQRFYMFISVPRGYSITKIPIEVTELTSGALGVVHT